MTDFEKFVASVNANGFHYDAPTGALKAEKAKAIPAKHRKLLDAAKELTSVQIDLILGVMSGEWAWVTAGKEHFAVQLSSDIWSIIGLDAEAEEHHVYRDLSACSCEDNKFRGRICKHILALRGIHRTGK